VKPLLLDAMLGELAKWLRLMGYDAAFIPDTDDLVVIRRARAEGRTLLTQDQRVAAHRAVDGVLIYSDDLDAQIAQVSLEVGPAPEPVTPRCPSCNAALVSLPHGAAKGRVPPYVWDTQAAFSACPACHRVFWKGTHWEGIEARINGYDPVDRG
jgi:hypothetical protein